MQEQKNNNLSSYGEERSHLNKGIVWITSQARKDKKTKTCHGEERSHLKKSMVWITSKARKNKKNKNLSWRGTKPS
ncbi:MAG: hypothetical protein ACPG5B_14020 [Chitinophagales bacterium]